MIRSLFLAGALLAVAAVAAETTPAASETANPPADMKALVEGQLPDAPARPLVQAKCLICHTDEYVTMQRLTEKQWQGTVDKMRKFGSPANDDEAKAMVAYLSRYWTPDLPPQRPVLAPPPAGSVPRK
ncbi:MAG: hypothetical protein ACXWLR_07805 [Myxococcales bacterium]